ncbi:SDR family oxidoreductase [Tumebacillus permanentifrigoris]|uniref:3-oxoacyl-[acyl-carrier protein] reductase n=1 Tax=Tumebacillus permanentifrigoris TaxID=378543 RepID=A0A316D7B3_9BACL|nr:SDR family oxidoreductase [Tumebacillus permanentifrigoris]PWK08958.1 3-oxoacyl-[acyl-carrier protein] reductase [Tumebacillus permanentifrigoris]
MDLGMKDKVVLVTAGSKGLGRAVALEFAREGASVMIASRSEEELAKTAREIAGETGAAVDFCVTDLGKRGDIDALFAKTLERFQRLDVLVTNAGGPPAGNFDNFEDDVWERVFQANLMNVVRLVRGALPHFRAVGGGRIVNITSTSIKQPIEGLLLSNTFRAGVNALAKSLSVELGPEGILVNTIAPGRISTDRIQELDGLRAAATDSTSEQVREGFERLIPVGRYGTPEEFARAAVFLGSLSNTYVTGQSLLVDGGMVRAL